MAKDLFSQQASFYARYRPEYPAGLFRHILNYVEQKGQAWDCATGNGQAALALAGHFKKIMATDISEKQLALAKQHPNIRYIISSAEQTPFDDNTFDLITVAQAYHWFNFQAFEKEARRVGKQGAVIAIWGYSLIATNNENTDAVIQHFYKDIIGPYWDKERTFVDDHYRTVPFHFPLIDITPFSIENKWTKDDLAGYFNTWSALQHFKKENKSDPVNDVMEELSRHWKDDEFKTVSFPVFLMLGRIEK